MYERKDIPSMNPEMYRPKCRVITPPATDACGKPAQHMLVFPDGDKAPACTACALRMRQTALAHSGDVKVEKLDDAPVSQ